MRLSILRSFSFFSTFVLTGCGSIHIEGEPLEVHASSGVRVEASVETAGGLTIVEQAPGAGFILEGSAPAVPDAPIVLTGFEAGASHGASGQTPRPHDQSVGAETHVATGSGGLNVQGEGGAPPAAEWRRGRGVSPPAPVGLDVDGRLDVEVETPAPMPREGVWGLDGRPTSLGALVEGGVQVDGIGVSLSDLGALADVSLPSSSDAQLSTDGALEAWAEVEHDALPATGGETRVVVRARAASGRSPQRARLRVHLVIDRSSSMQRSWARVLESARGLVARLAPTDEIHIVVYGSDATEVVPLRTVGDGVEVRRAIEQISVGGGTNIEAGLELAYRASAHARTRARGLVVLLSDGVPNHGAFEPRELGGMAARAAATGRCSTSVIGLGSEFDGRMLRRIARDGGGGYHVTTGVEGLAASLRAELDAHAYASAHDVRLRVQLPTGVEVLGLEDGSALQRRGRAVELALPFLDAGEQRRIVLRVRVGARSAGGAIATASVSYRPAGGGAAVHATRPLEVSVGPTQARGSAAAVGVLLDRDLSTSLDRAADAIRAGDASAAAAAMNAHASLVEGRTELSRSPHLQARVRVSRRLGRALGSLLPNASHPQRRRAAVAFGGLAERLLQ